jgi:hypothetical protein
LILGSLGLVCCGSALSGVYSLNAETYDSSSAGNSPSGFIESDFLKEGNYGVSVGTKIKGVLQFTPPTLLVHYANRAVAELKRVEGKYSFRYLDAFREMNLSPFPGLPNISGEALLDELPLFFKERLPDLRRPEINYWLYMNPKIDRNDDLQLLGELGAPSITGSFVLSRLRAA